MGLEPGEYFLYVSRLEPENNAHLVVKAFERVNTPKKLVVVGDAPYARDYIAQVKSTSDPRIVFPGAIYGTGYRELQSHAYCYVHATEVGGTHPALIEAMGCARPVLYLDTIENREVAGDAALAFGNSNDDLAAEDLAEKMRALLANPSLCAQYGRRALARVRELYQWDGVASQYERLFLELLGNRDRSKVPEGVRRVSSSSDGPEANDKTASVSLPSRGHEP